VSPVKYELVFYIPEDDILHSHRRENLKSYIVCSWLHGIGEGTLWDNSRYGLRYCVEQGTVWDKERYGGEERATELRKDQA
jgi:hypothetical protein